MDNTMFQELVSSLEQAKAIVRGDMEPARRFVVEAPTGEERARVEQLVRAMGLEDEEE